MNKIFILDCGSGNTCKNDIDYIRRMIDAIYEIDKNKIFKLKWQLFNRAGNNIPLSKDSFIYAYEYARKLGFETTASVFDIDNLKFLCDFDIPFVKIANRPDLYHLIGEVPRKIPVLASIKDESLINDSNLLLTGKLCCVSNYPAKFMDYVKIFSAPRLHHGISDHSSTWELFEKYQPEIYEVHFVLEHDSKNPDGGIFARTVQDLSYILGVME